MKAIAHGRRSYGWGDEKRVSFTSRTDDLESRFISGQVKYHSSQKSRMGRDKLYALRTEAGSW